MNDLPVSSILRDNTINSNPQNGGHVGGTNKEVAPIVSGVSEVQPYKENGPDNEQLPPEIASLGVKIHPTTIPVPQVLQQLGVQSVGANVGMPTSTIALPLTDDQIALGLTQSLTSSYHWLAEWCIRRLKQMHVGLKKIHGTIMRVTQ